MFERDRRGGGGNPATGEAIEISANKKITFRPAEELKHAA